MIAYLYLDSPCLNFTIRWNMRTGLDGHNGHGLPNVIDVPEGPDRSIMK